jgi:hypothetical protein
VASSYHTTHRLAAEHLAEALHAWVLGKPVNGDSFFRSTVALYSLLLAHPVDRHGRCRSCRQRRRGCRVYAAVSFYLHQPDHVVWAHVADELGHLDAPANAPTTVLPKTT